MVYLPAGAKTLPNDYAKMGMPQLAQYGFFPTPNHRYGFTLYALKAVRLGLAPDASYERLMEVVVTPTGHK